MKRLPTLLLFAALLLTPGCVSFSLFSSEASVTVVPMERPTPTGISTQGVPEAVAALIEFLAASEKDVCVEAIRANAANGYAIEYRTKRSLITFRTK
jgi:hypothetical protein